VILCIRGARHTNPSVITAWGTAEDALEADRRLYGGSCGRGCEGQHMRVWTTVGRLHVEQSVHTPPPKSREELFEECYPVFEVCGPRNTVRRVTPHTSYETSPKHWPTPSIYNRPLPPRGTPMNPETQRLQDEAVEQVAHRPLVPHPHGLSGRVADAHDEAGAAFDLGDIDAAIGAEMLADALTDAVLAEL
jgi:hypothetical protein